LKILSRITEPTTGRVTIKGRVGSLLEVGTGFHSELSGRENIYLNGAILGMTRAEIRRKFDEIVAFAEVEKYLDTPVKRYSSGMYVRLAFAVAAHLEPEILVVDEVLAVGDAEFQKRCLGKMDEVAKQQGRTVLFVSHNMAAIQNLCMHSVLLINGKLEILGPTHQVISRYLETHKTENTLLSAIVQRTGNGRLRFNKGIIKSTDLSDGVIETFSRVFIELYFEAPGIQPTSRIRIDVGINNFLGTRVAWLSTYNLGKSIDVSAGKIVFIINAFPLAPGDYNCNLFSQVNSETADWLKNVMPFKVIEKDYYGTGKSIPPNQGDILLDYCVSP
jgi:lipopolysaccharide transport system ATP-binding protein